MANGRKLLLGILATLLLAVLAHGPFGMGAHFVDRLANAAQAVTAQAPGVAGLTATVRRDGFLRRTIDIANGPADRDARHDIGRAIAHAIPGAGRLHWIDGGPAASVSIAADTGRAPSADLVKNCQENVRGAIAGKSVNFVSGGAALAADSPAVLDGIAAALGPCADMRIEVAGHTDATGGTARNQRLSEERANNVVAALIERGVPTMRLQPKGYGEMRPLDKGASEATFARNRRIEFSVAARN